jgi:hypothetical protein
MWFWQWYRCKGATPATSVPDRIRVYRWFDVTPASGDPYGWRRWYDT